MRKILRGKVGEKKIDRKQGEKKTKGSEKREKCRRLKSSK